MQQLVVIRRFMQQPLMVVFGVLTGAGAAKSGHGAWAAGGILTFLSIYFGAVVTFMATRSLAAWVARIRRHQWRADMAKKIKTRRVSAAIAIAVLAAIVIANAAQANTMNTRNARR
jgi:hypothetical protein